MSFPLVECIPNFSEARRPQVIDAILAAIQSVPEIQVLDRHSDLDHNRTVITFMGPPSAVEEAAFLSIAKAADLIDLNNHTGEHPRIGATDVVPFVPLVDTSMQDCVEMARRLGKRVAFELKLPVYLYEEAAIRPERQNLENIRRGEYEQLKTLIASDPGHTPDFGPSFLGPAGATVIGARQHLIAFNVYLTTNDVAIAEKIAQAVRSSSGGLRFVKAIGVLVNGLAQVSMNLTNYHQTPVARVVELVRREAAVYGVAIHHSQLVGLIPQEALVDASTWYLQLNDFLPEQILENRLAQIQVESNNAPWSSSGKTFLDQLASVNPTPAGGSASAYVGAMGTALVAMVARSTVSRKKFSGVKEMMWAIIDQAEALRASLTVLGDQDAAAYLALVSATRLPKDTTEQQAIRKNNIQQATIGASLVPLQVSRIAVILLDLAYQAAAYGNPNAIADAATAGILAKACLAGSVLNARHNLASVKEGDIVQPMLAELAILEQQAKESELKLRSVLMEKTNLVF